MILIHFHAAHTGRHLSRNALLILCLLVFWARLLPANVLSGNTGSSGHLLINGKIIRIIDGDSIEIKQIRGPDFSPALQSAESMRLIGIDAYEINDSREKYRMAARIQKDAAYHYLWGQNVLLELEILPSGQLKRDIYNRLLGYVILKDGRNYQEMALEKGFVKGFYDFPFKKEYQDLFRQAEKRSRMRGNDIDLFPPAQAEEDNWEKRIGEIVSVRFPVSRVRGSGKNLYLEHSKKMVLIVPKWAVSNFSSSGKTYDFTKLKNRWITASGFLSRMNGTPAIRIYFPPQLEVD
jgi:endonuclease YncB( thermonuclease family)